MEIKIGESKIWVKDDFEGNFGWNESENEGKIKVK